MTFLEKLDYLLAEKKFNKNVLSKKSGIPYTTIDGWYKKGYGDMRLSTLIKLSDFFNTNIEFWIDDTISPDTILCHKSEDKPQIIAASGGSMVSESTMSERDKDLMQTKQRLVNTIYAANLDKRQMEELIIMVNAFEKL